MRLLAATITCVAALAAGAGAGAAAPAPARLPPPDEFILLYHRSGGLAGGTRSLSVARGQLASAASSGTRAGKRQASFRLSGRRIRALERALRRARFGSLESPGPSDCADCFEYDIVYLGHEVELDDSQVPPRLGAVITQIESIIAAHTIPPNV